MAAMARNHIQKKKNLLGLCYLAGIQRNLESKETGKQISEFKVSLVQSKFQVKKSLGPGMVVHIFNPSTQETEAGRWSQKIRTDGQS